MRGATDLPRPMSGPGCCTDTLRRPSLGAVLLRLRSACSNSHPAVRGRRLRWLHLHPTQARLGPAAETETHCRCGTQNHASAIAVWRGLVHARTPANALRRSLAGAASEPVQCAVLAASPLGLRLTRRSSGPPTARRPGREAVLFIIGLAARAPRCRRPLNLHVRPHNQSPSPTQ